MVTDLKRNAVYLFTFSRERLQSCTSELCFCSFESEVHAPLEVFLFGVRLIKLTAITVKSKDS